MYKPITIAQLKKECEKQIEKGNGDDVIMISQDDEGNGYHYLWYTFAKAKDYVDEDCIIEDFANINKTSILG